MVKQIYTEEEFESIEAEYGNSAYYFTLADSDIEEWMRNGYFSHIKKELQVFNNLYFACQKGIGGCAYCFFFESEKARDRFGTLVGKLFNEGKKVRLVNCEPENDDKEITFFGSITACPLF